MLHIEKILNYKNYCKKLLISRLYNFEIEVTNIDKSPIKVLHWQVIFPSLCIQQAQRENHTLKLPEPKSIQGREREREKK